MNKRRRSIASTARSRNVRMNRMTADAVAAQLKAFQRKFGREPGPDDPVFFDPNASSPQPLSGFEIDRQIVILMEAAGIPPELIYAFKRTGLLVAEESYATLPEAERRAYIEALEEFDQSRQ
jgi:hypothetical protein